MKVLVTGDRNWTNLETIYVALNWLVNQFDVQPKDLVMVEGECRGADLGCRTVAEGMGFKDVVKMPAEWTKYGKAAGVIRNQQMLDQHPDIKVCLAFHDDLKNSKGTADMVKRCKRIAVAVWHFKTDSSLPTLL